MEEQLLKKHRASLVIAHGLPTRLCRVGGAIKLLWN
jgi:hypothetical protein